MNFLQHPILLLNISTIFLSMYYTLLKKFPYHIMLLYFWVHIFSYVGFAIIFLFQETFLIFDTTALQQLVFDTSYNNLPLYILSAICLLATYIIFNNLIKKYPVPKILALAQIALIFSTIGYIALGDQVTTISIIGIGIIFIGALISGLESFSYKNPLACLKNYDAHLLKLSIAKALLYSSTLFITYLCTTHYSATTTKILHELTKHLHLIPFVAISPIHFNIGIQFSNFICMWLFIKFYLHQSQNILQIMKKHSALILSISALYILYSYFYYEAFDLILNKNLINALSRLYLPLTLFICHSVYKQKVSKEEITGMTIITIGSLFSLLG